MNERTDGQTDKKTAERTVNDIIIVSSILTHINLPNTSNRQTNKSNNPSNQTTYPSFKYIRNLKLKITEFFKSMLLTFALLCIKVLNFIDC